MIAYRGRILALRENGPPPYELDGEAHAGELHAIAYYPAWEHIRHLVVGPSGRVVLRRRRGRARHPGAVRLEPRAPHARGRHTADGRTRVLVRTRTVVPPTW
ncbi:hypothetical protein [Streptomyces sp. NPDC002078]